MSVAPEAHRALLRVCDGIDELFLRHVGPFASFLAEETRDAWLSGGNKFNATHAFEYLNLLAKHITDAAKRQRFVDDAMHLVRA
jgi:hypothetical protein